MSIQIHRLQEAFGALSFMGERRPDTPAEQLQDCFAQLANYRDGAITIGHYAGQSEWERHPQGDEVVMVLEGFTTLFLLQEGKEQAHELRAQGLVIVPQGVWHRFETPEGVKVLTVTPQPSEHQLERPE